MATKTYYGLLDCLSTVAAAENLSQEYYFGFTRFMGYLSSSNQATLIAWNSGSILPNGGNFGTGSFETKTQWDGASSFGLGTHSVWRIHTSSTRNWEWYLYAQMVSSSAGAIRQAWNIPISGYGNTADNINGTSTNRGILLQAALLISGSASFNPWNGTGVYGASQASIPRWVSGSNTRNLFVLPRSNDNGGTHVYQKSNALTLGSRLVNSDTTLRYHFIYDGDALLCMNDAGDNGSYGVTYLGAYTLRTSLTSSGIGTGSYGFLMYSQIDGLTDTLTLGTAFGDTVGSTSTQNGGVVLTFDTMITGSKIGIVDTVGTFHGSAYQLNFLTSQYDEFPVYVGPSEGATSGLAGTLNPGLIRYARDMAVHDATADLSRAVFGGSAVTSNLKITTPWTGSVAPGLGTDRTGSLKTWSANYDV
jgi:hypothetical protein